MENNKNKDYLDEYIYDYIDDLCDTSDKYKDLSTNLKERLSELFDSIEDEDCDEILCDIDEINKYLIKLNNISLNELTMIKNNGKKLIEKYASHKEKIQSLKIENNMLKDELSTINEQKDQAFIKIDEINDELYKISQEKHNLEIQISIKETEETNKQKKDNEILNDEISSLNDRIEYLNKQLSTYEEKMNNISKKNKEILSYNSQLKTEVACKDELLRLSIEKNKKLNDEKESIRIMNRSLEKSIEELKNQCKDYQTVINHNEEQIKKIKETMLKHRDHEVTRKISLNSILRYDEEELSKSDANNSNNNNVNNNNINNNINIDILQKRRNAIDYTGNEINLNELIFDNSESLSSKSEDEAQEKKNQIKLAFSRVKAVRRFNRLKSLNYNIKKESTKDTNNRRFKHKKTVMIRSSQMKTMNDSNDDLNQSTNERLETIMTENDFESSVKLLKLKSKNNNNNNNSNNNNKKSIENDEEFLYELLFRAIDY